MTDRPDPVDDGFLKTLFLQTGPAISTSGPGESLVRRLGLLRWARAVARAVAAAAAFYGLYVYVVVDQQSQLHGELTQIVGGPALKFGLPLDGETFLVFALLILVGLISADAMLP